MSVLTVVKSYEDLKVFQRAYEVSLEIHKMSLGFPKNEQYALASQIRRSSKSICANVADGFAKQRYSASEYMRYIVIAIGSCDETRVWLKYCGDLNYIPKDTLERWNSEYQEIAKMLSGLQSSWSKK